MNVVNFQEDPSAVGSPPGFHRLAMVKLKPGTTPAQLEEASKRIVLIELAEKVSRKSGGDGCGEEWR